MNTLSVKRQSVSPYFQASQCISMDLDAADDADARCGYTLTQHEERNCLHLQIAVINEKYLDNRAIVSKKSILVMEHLHFYNSLQSPPDSTRARACVCVGRGQWDMET